MKTKLKNVKIGECFLISKKGVVWKKLQEQGIHNNTVYATTIVKTDTRCHRPGYKHRYLYNTDMVFIIDKKLKS